MQPADAIGKNGSAVSDHIKVIVETAKGGRNKYKFDDATRGFKLSKIMPEGMTFPFDFGFFPDTKSQDGDPLDVLILNDEPTFPGCQMDCRLIGVIRGMQTEQGEKKRNDRLIAVASASILFEKTTEISQLQPSLLKQLQEFFVNYQKARDISFEIISVDGPDAASRQLEDASVERAS
jgi:inorganic pyrophosphatase